MSADLLREAAIVALKQHLTTGCQVHNWEARCSCLTSRALTCLLGGGDS